ncbi:hypothetical protein GOV10_02640 [Candidatus Woesearchaeota archaeon]|nr:hypothetical protein [Candidatus Woesearchaeota archaeon]
MGSRAKHKRKQAEHSAAKKKVPQKFAKAAKQEDSALAKRMIRRARRLGMKFRMSLGPYKHYYCENCYARLKPGINSRVRVQGRKVIIFCAECKHHRRITITPRRKVKMKTIKETPREQKPRQKREKRRKKPLTIKEAAVTAAKKAAVKNIK